MGRLIFNIIFSVFMVMPHIFICEQNECDHCHETSKTTKKTTKTDCRSCCQTILSIPQKRLTVFSPEIYKIAVQFFHTNMAKCSYSEPELRPPIA